MDLGAFLSTITMGEYVAATDCAIAMRYFSKRGNEAAVHEYERIRQDELRHYRMLRSVRGRIDGIPREVKSLFRGEFLENHVGDLEPIVLMHAVFEPAAFAYLSKIRKLKSGLGRWGTPIKAVCAEILIDEARHMESGLSHVTPVYVTLSSGDQEKLLKSIARHQEVLSRVPMATIGNTAFAKGLVTSFQDNFNSCLKKLAR